MKLLVASNNPKKFTELNRILTELKTQPIQVPELVSLAHFPEVEEVTENGRTFEENAVAKALGYAGQTGCLTLADDSGLVVDALNGAPGVRSARFAGEGKDDVANCEKVLSLLAGIPSNKRSAQFECVVAVALPERILGTAKGVVRGEILREFRGKNGFGYDPIFYYPPFKQTLAEVSAEKKNKVSHRNLALRSIYPLIQQYLRTNSISSK